VKQEKEVHDRQQQADEEALKNLEANLQQLTNRQQQLSQEQVELQFRMERLSETASKNQNDHAQAQLELREMQDKHRQSK
jgi:structural maintenance of chromosome 1